MKLFELQQPRETVQFFNFGSMRDFEIFQIVVGRKIPEETVQDAYMTGVRTVKVKDQVYPALIPSLELTDRVEGILVSELTPDDIKRMEYYEDGLYKSHMMPVVVDKETVLAWVYSEHDPKLEVLDEDWSFEEYLEHKEEYKKEVAEWMQEY